MVGTVASASFTPGLMALAASASQVGFPCVVVQPFAWFEALNDPLVRSLPVPSPPLLPGSHWCKGDHQREYGWRRSQLHRVRMWRMVLEAKLDLLAMDLDHELGSSNPMEFIRALYAPPESHSWLPLVSTSGRAAPADVVAVWDGPGQRYLNVGIMWVRSTAGTRELARRAENRSWVGWEQQIFNEELNFNADLSGVRCCHTTCLKKLTRPSNVSKELPTKSATGTVSREKAEGKDQCRDEEWNAAPPPQQSMEPWAKTWTPNAEVLRSKHSQNRKIGRCNHESNLCVNVDASREVKYLVTNKGHALHSSNCTVPNGVQQTR